MPEGFSKSTAELPGQSDGQKQPNARSSISDSPRLGSPPAVSRDELFDLARHFETVVFAHVSTPFLSKLRCFFVELFSA